MTRAGFYLARLLRQEGPLAAMSVPQSGLLGALAGKSVALVGNARSLAENNHGAAIDAHDVVVRINRAPMPQAESHGTRTDWLALAVRLAPQDRARIGAGRYLWMSHKRKRLDWTTATSDGFYLHPQADYADLQSRLGAQPTTGAMMIDLLLRSELAGITLYGFDFFASLSLSGRRTAHDVPHDFTSEADFVAGLMAQDNRLIRR
ncbi:glycosyltransferase family 29 protein [Thioclava sp. GXIMD2076]|uniref:glycosyltransferase family 29 protein n=1 Tax=Thioclava sp. GXIMD2076 TaxID=3131931 RepID=UPI0030CC1954